MTSPPDHPRLLIAIPTCHRYSYFDAGGGAHQNGDTHGRANAVRDTWYRTWKLGPPVSFQQDVADGKFVLNDGSPPCYVLNPAYEWPSYPIDLKFFYGLSAEPQSPPQVPQDSVILDVPDDYIHLAIKVQEIFRYALAHGYDYVLKTDDDVFVWLDRLLDRFVPTDYLGFMAETCDGAYICGASYWVSRKAMEAVVAATWTLDDWAEDRWVGRVLREAGITPTHDDRHRVCHCDICGKKWPTSDCTTMHIWPNLQLMKELYGK